MKTLLGYFQKSNIFKIKNYGCRWYRFSKFSSLSRFWIHYRNSRTYLINLNGIFIRNLLVYGGIALVLWMLYAGIKGMKNKDQK